MTINATPASSTRGIADWSFGEIVEN